MTDPIFRVVIGAAPPRELWGNAKVNGWAQGKARKEYRGIVKQYLRNSELWTFWVPDDLWLGATILWPPKQRTLDDDNAVRALKSARDEIAEWLHCDDRHWRTAWVTQGRSPDNGGYVIVELYAEPVPERVLAPKGDDS